MLYASNGQDEIDAEFGGGDDEIGTIGYGASMGGRRGLYDPSEVSALPDDEGTPTRESALRALLVENTKLVLQKLLDDLTEQNASRVLGQCVAQAQTCRKLLRVYGAYDMPEMRRKRIGPGGLLQVPGLSPFGGMGVSDAETFGAVAMREGLSGFQDWMRSKKIDEMTQAYSRARNAKLDKQAEKIKAELDALLDQAAPLARGPEKPVDLGDALQPLPAAAPAKPPLTSPSVALRRPAPPLPKARRKAASMSPAAEPVLKTRKSKASEIKRANTPKED